MLQFLQQFPNTTPDEVSTPPRPSKIDHMWWVGCDVFCWEHEKQHGLKRSKCIHVNYIWARWASMLASSPKVCDLKRRPFRYKNFWDTNFRCFFCSLQGAPKMHDCFGEWATIAVHTASSSRWVFGNSSMVQRWRNVPRPKVCCVRIPSRVCEHQRRNACLTSMFGQISCQACKCEFAGSQKVSRVCWKVVYLFVSILKWWNHWFIYFVVMINSYIIHNQSYIHKYYRIDTLRHHKPRRDQYDIMYHAEMAWLGEMFQGGLFFMNCMSAIMFSSPASG